MFPPENLELDVVISCGSSCQKAQHNGLREFGLDFQRAPPLEFLTMLPELESSIEGLHQLLADLSTELGQVELPPGFEALRASLVQYVAIFVAKTTETCQAQRKDLELLAGKSPLYSAVCPLLLRRLSTATGSQGRACSSDDCPSGANS